MVFEKIRDRFLWGCIFAGASGANMKLGFFRRHVNVTYCENIKFGEFVCDKLSYVACQ